MTDLGPKERAELEEWILGAGSEIDLFEVLGLRSDCYVSEVLAAIERTQDRDRRRAKDSIVGCSLAELLRMGRAFSDGPLRDLYRRARASRLRGEEPEAAEGIYRARRQAELLADRERGKAASAQRLAALQDASECGSRREASSLADLHRHEGDLQLAIVFATRACELSGRQPATLNALASLLRKGGKPIEATRVAKESLAKDPSTDSNAAGWTALAAIVRGSEGRGICERVLMRRPNDPFALSLAGALAVDAGLRQQAEDYFERAAVHPRVKRSAVAGLEALCRSYARAGDHSGVNRLTLVLRRLGGQPRTGAQEMPVD